MKQGLLRGFGAAHLTGAVAPIDMPYEIVAQCDSEAMAVLLSINFAKTRFGYTQLDIARLCGWTTDSHLSAYKRGVAVMPERRQRVFAQVTGCNLLEQWQRKQAIEDGTASANDLHRAVLAQMLAVAA